MHRRYRLSDLSLGCGSIFDEPYAKEIDQLYAGTMSILYTMVISIHYQPLSRKRHYYED